MRTVAFGLWMVVALSVASASETDDGIRVGLALSGGGALGFAHVGVLKVLEKESMPVAAVAGTSMGAMVGGVWSAGFSAQQIESIALNVEWSRLFSTKISIGSGYLAERQRANRYIIQLRHRRFVPQLPGGVIPLQNVDFLLMRLLSDIEYSTYYDFDSLPVPFRAVAVDLLTGRRVVLRAGRLQRAIRASIAIPGVFAPEQIDSMQLVDGGVQQRLPVEPLAEFGPDFVIAVLTRRRHADSGGSVVDIAARSVDLVGAAETEAQKALADFVIEPDLDRFRSSDFARAAELIAIGESAAQKALPELKRRLAGKVKYGKSRTPARRPRPVVRSVRLEGLRATRPSVVMRNVRTRAGGLLSFSELVDDLERIYATGLFESVRYRLEPVVGDSTDVVIELSEPPHGFYGLGVRYDNSDGVGVGLAVGQGNLFGSGMLARGAFTLGNPTEVRAGLEATRLFGLPLAYRFDGMYSEAGRIWWWERVPVAYGRTALTGIETETGWSLGQEHFWGAGLVLYRARHRALVGTLPDSAGVDIVAGLTGRLDVNTYRDIDFPGPGRELRIRALYSLPTTGGGRRFLKLLAAGQNGVALGRRLLWRGGFSLGLIVGRPALNELLRTGGERFVGFADGELAGDFQAAVRGGFDYRLLNLFEREDYPVYIQTVIDAGIFERPDLARLEAPAYAALHWGAGFGLRTNTPAGPLQFLVGAGDFPRPGRSLRFEFVLSVGRDFRYER